MIDQTSRVLNTGRVISNATVARALRTFFSIKFALARVVLAIALSTALGATPVLAAMTLTTTENDIQVYSGPGERFRVLAVLPAKTELKASSQITTSRAGRFYRVVVPLGEKQRAIGFIPVSAPIRLGGEDLDEDELSKYGAVALINRAVQITFSTLRDQQSLYSIGYMHYFSPGFYAKGSVGQWIAPTATGNFGGGEIGNDSLLAGPISGFVTYGLGLFSPSANDAIFAGSTKLNIMMNATVGIRYNLEGFASIALGGQQTVIYNANNSLVSAGIQASLEVGL